ncbi:RVT-2 domain containing protein [Pyrenophora tritici-repentis]|nr:RVT-2 domain containing protein [Pyrenophora tritici-repentis]
MSIKDHNLPMLNNRSDWIDWYNSIEDLAKRNDVWKYCDPLGIENLVFTSTKPSDSASKDTIQKFQSLQSIFDSEKKKYDKVSERIDYTVCQEFKQHYLGKHDVRSKLIALSDSIQPNAKDQRQEIRNEFEKLRKGPGNTSLDKWLGRWPTLVNSARRYNIENLGEPQICDAFIEACRDINPPFYNYMKSKDAQTESQASIINQTTAAMKGIADALIEALNTISPDQASNGSISINDSNSDDSDDSVDEVDAPAVQRAKNKINRTLRSFRRLKPTLSDNRITIGFCIKQFRSMAPPSEKSTRGRAAHATLQGRKHGRDPKTSEEEDGQPRRKREAIESSSASRTQASTLRDCYHTLQDSSIEFQCNAKDWKTPFEMVHGRKPDLSHIRIIGARAYIMVKNLRDRPSRAKLQEKAIMGWLIGTEATNIYKVWIPQSNRVITSRDVRIDEKILYDPRQSMDLPRDNQALLAMLNEIDMDESEDGIIPNGNDITEPAQSEAEAQHEQTSSRSQEVTSFQKPSNLSKFGYRQAHYPTPISMESGQLQTHMVQESRETRSRTNKDTTAVQNRHTISEGSTQISQRGQENINTSQAHATKRYTEKKARRQAHALQLERAKLGQQVAHAFAVAQSMRTHREDLLPPPEFWHQLKRHPERNGFRHAAEAELKSLKEKGTFELVVCPEGKQILPLKWVFTYKCDDAGYLIRHKARICVRGDLQQHASDDIYAATGAYRSFRILMALVCAFGLLCHQIDFKNAFTNAEMDEEVYTSCPPGYYQQGKVWKLRKALYGLRKSPKLWFNELTKLILFLYVDDMLVIAQPEYTHLIKEFKLKLNSKYGIKDMGEATSFLNIRIQRNTRDKKLWLSQHGYIEKICTKYGIDDTGRTVMTPLLSSYRPQKYEGQATLNQIAEMQEKVGSILYAAVVSRPDVSFAASQLSQFTTNPSPEHLRYANRVLSYLHATKYYAIEFLGSAQDAEVQTDDEEVCELSSDASFADDPETRRSTQGYLMKLFKGPIMWQSSKQKTVTTSTTEAELLSLSHTARETIGLYRLFKQIQFDPEHQPRILCDNLQTTGLVQKTDHKYHQNSNTSIYIAYG